MAIPLFRAMEAAVDGLDHVIRPPRRAHGTEDQSGVLEGCEHVFVPPTDMAELGSVAVARIEPDHCAASEVLDKAHFKADSGGCQQLVNSL